MSNESEEKTISFSKAWKDFLIIKSIPYKLGYWVFFDNDKNIIGILLGPTSPLKSTKIDDHEYLVDESIGDIPLVYPKEMFIKEVNEKFSNRLIGKRLAEVNLNAISGTAEKEEKKYKTMLGAQARNELQKLIDDKKYWEALFSIHPIIEHRLRRILVYKTMNVHLDEKKIIIDPMKENIVKEIRTFKHLTESAFLVGAIDQETKTNILTFDSERNEIAHELLKREVSQSKLNKACLHGLKLLDDLEKSLSKIIPKPSYLVMRKLEIPDLP